METISKGQMLGRLLERSATIHDIMKKLFVKNSVPTWDLTTLRQVNRTDYDRWHKLQIRSIRIQNLVTYTVLGR